LAAVCCPKNSDCPIKCFPDAGERGRHECHEILTTTAASEATVDVCNWSEEH